MCNYGLIALCCTAAFMGTVMVHAAMGVLVWAITQADLKRTDR